MKKIIDWFVGLVFFKNLFDKKFPFSYEERYTYYESKKAKQKYVSPYYFLFYSQHKF